WDTNDALVYGLVGVPMGLCAWGSITFAMSLGMRLLKRLQWSMSTWPSESEAAERMGVAVDEVKRLVADGKIQRLGGGDVTRASVDAYMAVQSKEATNAD